MTTKKRIPIFYTFTNWIITVILGSLLLPAVGSAIGGNNEFSVKHYFDDDTLGIVLISMVASAVCSLPALIVLFIAHLILNRSQHEINNHQMIQNVVHIGVSFLTFLVFALNMNGSSDKKFLYPIAITYTLVGMIVWNITYLLRRRRVVEEFSNEEVLDEL